MEKHLSENERSILEALKIRRSGMTRLETARCLGMPKSQYVTNLLEHLVKLRFVTKRLGHDSQRRNCYYYYFNKARYEKS